MKERREKEGEGESLMSMLALCSVNLMLLEPFTYPNTVLLGEPNGIRADPWKNGK